MLLNPDKVMITAIRDPFDPYNSRDVYWVEFEGKTAFECMKEVYPLMPKDVDVAVSLNGGLIKVEELHKTIPQRGDNLVFCLIIGDDSTWRMIAMIVVMVAAWYVAPVFAGAAMGSGMAGTGLAGYAAFTTMVVGGSMLVNSILPPQMPDLSIGNIEGESPTYGWSGTRAINITEEGKPWPILYGTVRVFPYLIGKYVETLDNKQFINLLFACADNPLDVIDEVEVNENDIDNYEGVTTEKRYGTNIQTVIPSFDNSYNETYEGAKLSYGTWAERNISSSGSTEGVVVGITLPQGLGHYNDDGSIGNGTINIKIDYSLIDPESWIPLVDETVTKATTSAVRMEYLKTALPIGSYKIRASLGVEPPTTTRDLNDTYLEYTQGFLTDDFTYPGTSLLAVRALATDQLSGGVPRISTLITRSNVFVHTGSEWESKPANNPAWACYDMHVSQEYGAGINYRRMNYSEFSAWADFCTTNNYTCNMYFDTFLSFSEAIGIISTLGRAQIVQRGTNFGVVVDQVDTPDQLFGINNIIEGSFETSYLARKDRANVIEVTYFDKDKKYTRQSFELRTPDFDTDENIEEKKIAIVLFACTNKTMAGEYAQFLLNCNQYLLRTVTFDVGVDAIASTVGEVVYVSHDVPQWGESGRVINGRLDYVQIDREVIMEAGETYHVMVRHSDDDSIEEVEVINNRVEMELRAFDSTPESIHATSFLAVATNFTKSPKAEDVYAFGKVEEVAKEFRIVTISRTQEMERRVTALEYRSEVYSDTVTIQEIEGDYDIPYVSNLKAIESYKLQAGVSVAYVSLSWTGFGRHSIFMKESGGTYVLLATLTGNNYYEIDSGLEPGKSYYFAVSTTDNPGDGEEASLAYEGWITPSVIFPISGLQIEGQGNDTIWDERDLKLNWRLSTSAFPDAAGGEPTGAGTFPPGADFGGYRIQILNPVVTDPFENTSDYILGGEEQDSITVVSDRKIEITDLQPVDNLWFIRDKGVDYFRGDFEIHVQFNCTSLTGVNPSCNVWALTNDIATLEYIDDVIHGDYICLRWRQLAGHQWFRMEELANGFSAPIPYLYDVLSLGTEYYLKITRVMADSKFGTLYCHVYDDEDMTSLVDDSLSLELRKEHKFRYNNWLVGEDIPNTGGWNGTIQNVKIVSPSRGSTHIRREEFVTEPYYNYTWEKNFTDGLSRDLAVKVWAEDRHGNRSSNYSTITVSNPPPTHPANLTAEAWMRGVKFSWDRNTERDFTYYSYRTKVGSDGWSKWIAFDGNETFRFLTTVEVGDYSSSVEIYIEVRSHDTFTNVSISSAVNETSLGLNIESTDIEDFAVTASKIHTKIPILQGDTWTDDAPDGSSVTWNQHTVYYNGAEYTISGDNTNKKYIWWVNEAGSYSSSDTHPALNDGDFIIATNIDGEHDLAWNAIANQVIGSAYIQQAAILTAHIDDLAVETAKINDLAVETLKIKDLAVETAKIANLAVETGKIANLAVETAKIANLAVDTLQIKGEAVTIPISRYTAASTGNFSSWTTVQNATILSTGAPIAIIMSCRVERFTGVNSYYVRCLRGATPLFTTGRIGWTIQGSPSGWSAEGTQWSGVIADTPGVGSVTYYFQVSCSGPTLIFCSIRSLVLLETKK